MVRSKFISVLDTSCFERKRCPIPILPWYIYAHVSTCVSEEVCDLASGYAKMAECVVVRQSEFLAVSECDLWCIHCLVLIAISVHIYAILALCPFCECGSLCVTCFLYISL